MPSDHVTIVGRLEVADVVPVDVEVIAPELDHAFVQLSLREGGAIDGRVLDFGHDLAQILAVELIGGHAERGVVRRHEGGDRTIIDHRRLQLFLEVLAEAKRFRARQFVLRDAERGATHEAANGIAPDGQLRVRRHRGAGECKRDTAHGFRQLALCATDALRLCLTCAEHGGGGDRGRKESPARRHGTGRLRAVGLEAARIRRVMFKRHVHPSSGRSAHHASRRVRAYADVSG